MTVDGFWKLIARVDRTFLHRGEGYDEAAIRPLVDALAALEKADLQSFQDHLAQVLYDLDGRAYFDASIDAAGTDDSFLYVRCFVVAMGKTPTSALCVTLAKCPINRPMVRAAALRCPISLATEDRRRSGL